jgi:hypothetical protein
VKYCVGLTFVAFLDTIVVYAVHGWGWDSKFAGGRLTLSLPEFVAGIHIKGNDKWLTLIQNASRKS